MQNREPAHFGRVEDHPPKESTEIRHFVRETAAAGEADGKNQTKDGSQHHFFKKDDALFD